MKKSRKYRATDVKNVLVDRVLAASSEGAIGGRSNLSFNCRLVAYANTLTPIFTQASICASGNACARTTARPRSPTSVPR